MKRRPRDRSPYQPFSFAFIRVHSPLTLPPFSHEFQPLAAHLTKHNLKFLISRPHNQYELTRSFLLGAFICVFFASSAAHAADSDLWKTHIHPILSQNCFKCHSELKQKAGLDVSSLALILKGGERGPAVIPGKPNDSLLFQFIQPGADPHMPPKDHQLTEEEIATIKRWITTLPVTAAATSSSSTNKSAAWETTEENWVRPNSPAKAPPSNLSGSRAIDFYIRDRWSASKVKPTRVCDDRTFVRRIYLDLLGRIPTTERSSGEDKIRPQSFRTGTNPLPQERGSGANASRADNGAVTSQAGRIDAKTAVTVPSPGGPQTAERSFDSGHLSSGGLGKPLGQGEGGLSLTTLSETESFLRDRRPNKRELLIDRLLQSPEFARTMAETFDVLLTGTRSANDAWKDYLRYAFSTNRHWDEIARDLIVARPSSKELKGAVHFLYAKKNNYQAMAEAVAPAFLGFQLNCAQCHNHPLAPEIKQKHYWGLVAFFNRSKNVLDDGPAISESAIGGFVKFANLKKESQEALLTFVNDKTIPEKRAGDNEKEDDSPDKYLGEGRKSNKVPKFSRREQLAELVTHDNPLLARSFVNRMWTIIMGRGLVHPSDRMDSSHPPSHPDLLAWLAHDFEQNGYDIRRLVRNICLSDTYQLDSKWASGSKPQPDLFACGLEKPLRAEVMLRSLLISVGEQPDASGDLPGYDSLERMFNDRFPEVLPTEFTPNLRQGLFLTNNKKLDELLKPEKENTTATLLKLSGPREQVDAAFIKVLGRLPDRDEKRATLDFMAERLKNREVAVRELLWALLTSAEFRFNH